MFTEVLFLCKIYIKKKINKKRKEKNRTQFPRVHLYKQANQLHGPDLSWVPQSSHHLLTDSSAQLCLEAATIP